MSSIHEGKVLFLSNLPSGLISRRQLRDHFSAFGTVERISVDKNLGNCLISFTSYSDAFKAKIKGKIWNNIPLNIYWDRNSNLDPRSIEESKYLCETNEELVDALWSDDDKECFGIIEDKTSRAFKNKRQKTFNDLISSHLKLSKNEADTNVKQQPSGTSSPSMSKYGSEIKHKEERKIPVIFSGSENTVKDKAMFVRNLNQGLASEASGSHLVESILKRKIEQSKDLNISNSNKKTSIIKTSRHSRKTGESVLKKKMNDVSGTSILKEHGDHFIERKIVEAMETGSAKQFGSEIKKQSKPKESITSIKKTSIRTKLTKKKSVDVITPSKLIHDGNIGLQLKNKFTLTLKEKYSLLDDRDKVLRKLEVKDSNVKTAGAMKGTCPDMCPEKERIMRSFQRLVSVYEMGLDTNEMVEHLAVKEYSRSSADQDEPLSHELRPGPVLRMTMNYLITNIINRVEFPEENIAEWYNFCWDRLRGIRKDIIQQQLCNLEAVEIIEQCARFHIFCYDYLWGMDVSIFDDKINIENLMNCLQTLMHMYEDLSKHDIFCPNEAEFNAYMIVLKLSSGDILWEYRSFSSEVRLSPFIKAAIDLYNAFNSKICSRFFSIVKKSPYLLACLSHRFFSNIRTSALETIAKAYTPRGKVVILPLEYMKSALKFDSTEDTVMFCESHGIFLNENKQEFSIKKNSFYKPDSAILVKSFSSIIRNMRLTPAQAVVGENNEIPKYIPHEVHSSFDDEGKLKPEALDASDQLQKINERFSRISSLPPAPEDLEPMSPATVPTMTHTQDVTKPTVEESKGKHTFKFVLPPNISPDNSANTSSVGKVPVSPKLITGDVFKTPDNSFVEHDVLQIPVEDLPQDLYDPFYDTQDNQVNDIQAVDIDAERVEEIYQDVKKYYEHVDEPDLSESSNKHLSSVLEKENKDPLLVSPKSAFSFTLNDKENVSGSPDLNIAFKTKGTEIKHFENMHSLPSQNLKLIPETKTNFKLKLDEENKKLEQIIKQHEEELLRLHKVQKEMARKREIEAKRRKKIEEAKLLKKLKKDLRERLKVVNARFYAKRWKEKVERLKKSREDFPVLVQLSVKDHLTLWGSIGHSKQPISVGITQRLKQKNTITNVVNQVLRSGIPNSVPYSGDLLAEQIANVAASKFNKKGSVRPIFWKLIVSIPSSINKDTATLTKLIEMWCKRMFYKNEVELGSVHRIITSLHIPVYICVHLLRNINDFKLCNGMSSLLFVTVNQWETTEQTVHRFLNLVTSQNSQNSCFVSVMKIGGFTLEEELKENLIACKNDGIIGDWMFQEWSNPNCISQSLKLMTQHINLVPEICAAPIDFLLKEVVDQFFSALSADHCSSVGLRNASLLPNNIIRLFNICVAKLEDILLSSKLEKYSHFPEEFKPYISQLDVPGGLEQFSGCKYNRGYKMKISKIIQLLALPEFTNWPPKSCDCLLKMLKSYCSKVNDVTLAPKIIRLIDFNDDNDLGEHLGSVSWINITELWAKQTITYQLQRLNKKPETKTLVLYNKEELNQLLTSQWWLKTAIVINNDFENSNSVEC